MARKTLNVLDESRSITKTIVLLAWPVFVEQILTTLVSYADTAMVGSMGAWATASVSISNSPIMLLNGIIMALGVGVTSLVARAVGEGNPEKVKSLIRHDIMAIGAIGLPICILILLLSRQIPIMMGADPEILDTAAEYNRFVSYGRIFAVTTMMINSAFRGYGDTKTPLVINTVMNIVNVIFNFLLIHPTREITFLGVTFTMWGAGLAVKGAAIATSIGGFVAGMTALIIVFFRKNEYRISFKDSWKLDRGLVKQIFSISLPAMLERLFMSTTGVLVSSSIASLGTVYVAANSLGLTAESMSFMPAFAFQTAVVTLVGQSLGANKPDLAVRFVRRTILLGCITMCFTGVCLFVFSNELIGIFTPDAEVIEIAAACLRIVAFMQVPQVCAWTLSGVLRGAGDTKYNFYVSAGTSFGIRAVFSVVCLRFLGMGLIEMQYIMAVETFARLALLYARYRSGRWKYALKA